MDEEKMENGRKIPVLLNLCDEISYGARPVADAALMVRALREYASFPTQIRGIRIGAETCGFLFAGMNLTRFREIAGRAEEVIGEGELEIRLVIPVIEQSAWKAGADLIMAALREPWLDSVTVNDFGAMRLVLESLKEDRKRNIQVILGRFFDKRFRDPRIVRESSGAVESALNTVSWGRLFRIYDIKGLESECLEEGYVRIPCPDKTIDVHLPYYLQSSGQICEFSGIGMAEKDHFQIGRCRRQCLGLRAYAHHKELKKPMFKAGNALYVKNGISVESCKEIVRDQVTVIYTDI